jgi:hypothetical protein
MRVRSPVASTSAPWRSCPSRARQLRLAAQALLELVAQRVELLGLGFEPRDALALRASRRTFRGDQLVELALAPARFCQFCGQREQFLQPGLDRRKRAAVRFRRTQRLALERAHALLEPGRAQRACARARARAGAGARARRRAR